MLSLQRRFYDATDPPKALGSTLLGVAWPLSSCLSRFDIQVCLPFLFSCALHWVGIEHSTILASTAMKLEHEVNEERVALKVSIQEWWALHEPLMASFGLRMAS